jgi:hypothetical protein
LPPESQHPLGQEAALQTQVPVASQVCPVLQAAHCPPFLPQAPVVGVVHCPAALQQPPLHDVASQVQAPLSQAWPVAQAEQAAPRVPQAAAVVGLTQLPLSSQQPLGQEVALQAPVDPPAAPEAPPPA